MIRNYSKHGTYSIGSDGGINYHRGTQDVHGGRGEQHRQEMQSIAEHAIAQQVPQMAAAGRGQLDHPQQGGSADCRAISGCCHF